MTVENTTETEQTAITLTRKNDIVAPEMSRQTAVMTPMDMLDRAVAQNANIDTLEKLMGLQERWEANQALKAFNEAIAQVKASMPKIQKNKKVDFTTSKGRTNYQYEDLSEVLNKVEPLLSQHGLSVRYRTTADPNQPICVTCIISHRLGHSEENSLVAGRDDSGNKNSIQAIGSTVTYLQRYTLKAALGLAAAADDDGKKADLKSTISDGEREQIMMMIEDTGTDIQKFCQYLQIDSLKDMPTNMFKRAVSSLEAKKRAVKENA